MKNITPQGNKVQRPSLLAYFARPIPYFPALRRMGISTDAAILMTQLEYWFDKELARKNKHYFYKFYEPPKGENTYGYKKGDSWSEELCWTPREFNKTFNEIGVQFKSKGDFDKVFKKDPQKIFEKTVITKKRKIGGWEKEEITQQFCYASYYDRMRRKVYYFRNDVLVEAVFEELIADDPNVVKSKPLEEVVNSVDRNEESYSTRNAHSAVLGNAHSEFPLSGDYKQEINIYTKGNGSSLTKKKLVSSVPVSAGISNNNNELLVPGSKTKSVDSISLRQSISKSQSNTLMSNKSANEHNNYSDYLFLHNKHWISSYRGEFGSGKEKLVPLTQEELIEMSKRLVIKLEYVCKTHKAVIEHIQEGRFKQNKKTWDILEQYLDNNIARGFMTTGLKETEEMLRDELTYRKIMARKKLRKYQKALIDKGVL